MSRGVRWTLPTTNRGDPGHTTGVADYAIRPRCQCGHPFEMHKDGRNTCSAADPKKCPCLHYAPEVPDAC